MAPSLRSSASTFKGDLNFLKSKKSRLVNLPDFLVSELRHYVLQLKIQSFKAGKGDTVGLLFEDPIGRKSLPYSQRKIQDWVKRVCKLAKLGHRHPHDFRHTFVSTLLMSHMSIGYIQQQVGHRSIKTALDIYWSLATRKRERKARGSTVWKQ